MKVATTLLVFFVTFSALSACSSPPPHEGGKDIWIPVNSNNATISFGDFAGPKTQSRKVSLHIHTNQNPAEFRSIRIWLDRAPRDFMYHRQLKSLQLQAAVDEDEVNVSTSPITLLLSERESAGDSPEGDQLRIDLVLTIDPTAPPGTYRGRLYLELLLASQLTGFSSNTTSMDSPKQTYCVDFLFKVKPWARLSPVTETNALDKLIRGRQLHSLRPVVLKVASNTTWELKGWVNVAGGKSLSFKSKSPSCIHMTIQKERSTASAQRHANLPLTEEPRVVLIGAPTANKHDGVWQEIQVVTWIDDYAEIPAGKYQFHLTFVVVPLNPW